MSLIKLLNVSKQYDFKPVLRDVFFRLSKGDRVGPIKPVFMQIFRYLISSVRVKIFQRPMEISCFSEMFLLILNAATALLLSDLMVTAKRRL